VLFATRVAAEKYGTLTNHAGHVQRVEPAIEPMADARSEGEVLAAIGAALGLPGFDGGFGPHGYDPHAVSKALSESVPAFANASLDAVGDGGAPLSKGDA
jgi:predicted molibdopterin-dependent oxidoreductase YjgC